jgi:hypothetical protein
MKRAISSNFIQRSLSHLICVNWLGSKVIGPAFAKRRDGQGLSQNSLIGNVPCALKINLKVEDD